MTDLYIGFMIALNFVFLVFAVPIFLINVKRIQPTISQIENLTENIKESIKNREQIVEINEINERVKKLEDINQKMSKYLDTVENRLQSLKSEV